MIGHASYTLVPADHLYVPLEESPHPLNIDEGCFQRIRYGGTYSAYDQKHGNTYFFLSFSLSLRPFIDFSSPVIPHFCKKYQALSIAVRQYSPSLSLITGQLLFYRELNAALKVLSYVPHTFQRKETRKILRRQIPLFAVTYLATRQHIVNSRTPAELHRQIVLHYFIRGLAAIGTTASKIAERGCPLAKGQ